MHTGPSLSTPLITTHYYHRALNPIKLCDIGYIHAHNIHDTIQQYAMDDMPMNTTWRMMRACDVAEAYALWQREITKSERYDLVPVMTQEEFGTWT